MNNACVNLLPRSYQNHAALRRACVGWIAAWLILGCAGWLLSSSERQQARASTNELRSLKQNVLPVEHLKSQIAKLESDIQGLQQSQLAREQIMSRRPTVTLLGAISSAAAQGAVNVTELVLKQPQGVPGKPATYTLTLSGFGVDNLAIADFASRLRDSQCFDDVQLKSTKSELVAGHVARRYLIECHF